jgi:hypothetical protein
MTVWLFVYLMSESLSTLSFSFDDAFSGRLLTATWTVRGSNPRGRGIIRTVIREAHQASCTGSLQVSKRPVRRADHPAFFGAEAANVLELHLFLPCVPPWHVIGVTVMFLRPRFWSGIYSRRRRFYSVLGDRIFWHVFLFFFFGPSSLILEYFQDIQENFLHFFQVIICNHYFT